jgi:hypothetical protein
MSGNRQKVLCYMLAVKNATVAQITKDLGISSTSVTQHHLKQLRIDGLLPPIIPLSKKKAVKKKEALLKVIAELDKIINN